MVLSRLSLSTVTSIILLSFFLPGSIHAELYEGDSCTVDNSPGICSTLKNCPSVYEELLKGQPPRSICVYMNFTPIICCPLQKETTTVATTTTSTLPPIDTSVKGAKAKAKCGEYAKSVFALEIPPTLAVNKVPVNISLCAIKTQKLIVGGKKVQPREFPHMAAVGFNSSNGILWLCGGTLISERFVLTAAHCTFSSSFGKATWVRVGDLNLKRNDDDAKPQDIEIIDRIRHPLYKRPSEYHDIALLRLKRDVEFNAWVRPSCLAYSLPDTGTDGKATATGWGQVDWADDVSDDLLKVTISLVSHSECESKFTNNEKDTKLRNGIVDDWQICAGERGKDTCQGDSGGPLVILNQDFHCMYNVIGVTSLGKLCGSIAPGIYTRVYNYLSWIEDTVWPDL